MSQIKERPILFSGAMVRALLDGSKTQTRRIVKSPTGTFEINSTLDNPKQCWLNVTDANEEAIRPLLCPYGQPGERLWVRETWGTDKRLNGLPPNALFTVEGGNPIYYRADEQQPETLDTWRPSIHMPRVASRLLLEVVSVRVERLTSISEADAVAEGIEPYDLPGVYKLYGSECSRPIGSVAATRTDYVQPVKSYESLWELINGAGSWALNPWVWVVEFKVIQPA